MYRIRIENLETGRYELDMNTDCVFAVVHIPGEDANKEFVVAKTSRTVLDEVLLSAQQLILKIGNLR